LDGLTTDEGLILPYDSDDFLIGSDVGSATLRVDRGSGHLDMPALFAMRDGSMEIDEPGEFQGWPWGPVFGLAITAPGYRRGGSVWFQQIGEEADDAGNPLVSDVPIYGVIDLGPLGARHEFDEEPPLLGFSAAQHVAAGPSELCEAESGCVVITQLPSNCDLEGNHVGSSMQPFSFRVGGPDVAATGVRIRYRVLSMVDYGHPSNFLSFETGVNSSKIQLALVSGLATPRFVDLRERVEHHGDPGPPRADERLWPRPDLGLHQRSPAAPSDRY
jgi:hypothetical protein